MRRGDVCTAALPGDFGKPRPSAVVQTDVLNTDHATFVLCPFTSKERDLDVFRFAVDPTPTNGLTRRSYLMTDKIFAVKRERVGGVIGRLDAATMEAVDRALVALLDLGHVATDPSGPARP